MVELQGASAGVRDLIDDNREQARLVMTSLQETMSRTSIIVDNLSRGQGTLGRALNDPEPWIQLRSALERLNEILGSSTQSSRLSLDYQTE